MRPIMRRPSTPRPPRRAARRLTAAAASALACLGLGTGCNTDKLLEVENPSIAQPGNLTGAAGLSAYYAAAVGDFIAGYSGDPNGDYEGLINYGGLLSDEIGSVDTFPTRNETDQRRTQFDNGSNADIFRAIQRARATAELAASQFAASDVANAANDPRRSEALSLAGYSYILMAEDYCSGVPIGGLAGDGVTIQNGTPQTTAQLLETAILKFDTALTIAGTSAANAARANLARVGRARALLDLGRRAEAAAQAAQVPASFSFNLTTSANTTRQNNGVFYYFNLNQRFSAIDKEGGNGLPYLSADDPRVPYEDTGDTGFDGARELIVQLKYPDRTSNLPLATGAEALLIQAEGALTAGNSAGFVDFLNQARAAAGVTDQVTDPGTDAGRVDLLFRERAFTLWLTAHRLGDMRRLVRPVSAGGYGRDVNTVFPTGAYSAGGSYGTDVNLPIPIQEQSNPNYTGACDKTAP